MTIAAFVAQLRSAGIRLRAEGERLHCTGTAEALTTEIRSELGRRKVELLAFLEQAQACRHTGPPALRARSQGEPTPASSSQLRLWLLQELEGGAHYNCFLTVQVAGELSVPALEASLAALADRHEALRTRFSFREGQLWQEVAPTGSLPLAVVTLDEPSLPTALDRLRQEIARPFDLAAGPLARACLLRLGARDHLVQLTVHHIVFDGWSNSLALQELLALYAWEVGGRRGAPLAPLRVQFPDYIIWERQALTPARRQALIHYWRRRLAGAQEVLRLPLSGPRPPVQTYQGSHVVGILSAAVSRTLDDVARDRQATLFMVLLAGWQLLLSRHSGQDDFMVGSPVATRPSPETEKMLGFLVNTVVFRASLRGSRTFRELLANVREACLEDLAHAELPFDALIEALGPARNQACTPFFQTFLAVQNYPEVQLTVPGCQVRLMRIESQLTKFDLSLYAYPNLRDFSLDGQDMRLQEGDLIMRLEYNTSLFDQALVERLRDQYLGLLAEVARQPDLPLNELAWPGEQESCLEGPAASPADPATIHALFEAQVAASPQAVAGVHEDKTWSYAQLDARAGVIAGALRQRGVGPRDLVALALPRSLDLVASMLAIWKVGAAYLPITRDYPPARVAMMLEEARPQLLLTDSAWLPDLPEWPDVLLLSEAGEGSPCSAPPAGHPTDLAYVIFTSGSTGRPKAVEVEHASVVHLLRCLSQPGAAELPRLGPRDVLVAVTPLTFDISVLELILPLTVGGRTVVAPAGTSLDGPALLQLLQDSGATVLQATPSTWKLLLAANSGPLPQLRAFCGGEAFSMRLARDILGCCSELWNMYGPTEATVWCSMTRVPQGAPTVPLGPPLPGCRFLVLNEDLRPVPAGLVGDLYVSGPLLARGYRGQPELTNERFRRLPSGERIYRTGDRVRLVETDRLEFLGRGDHQVKLRGHRIELEEVERTLGQHPAVTECLARLHQESLVAYLSCRGAHPPVQELRRFLAARLPAYMVPSQYAFLESLPVSPNGKLDRLALPSPPAPASPARREEPQGELERALAQIWSEVLHREVGRQDNFFDVGGDSLLLVQVFGRIQQGLRKKLSLIDLFEHPDIMSLAGHLEQLP